MARLPNIIGLTSTPLSPMSACLSLYVSRSVLLGGIPRRCFVFASSFSSSSSSKTQTLYTARTQTTGGRNGQSKSDDGKLSVTLSTPKEMQGEGKGTNPEQLFSSGYSACFLGALGLVARKNNTKLPTGSSIDSRVSLQKDSNDKLGLSIEMDVHLPGMDKAEADKLVAAADQVCPYSRAIRNNVPVKLTVV